MNAWRKALGWMLVGAIWLSPAALVAQEKKPEEKKEDDCKLVCRRGGCQCKSGKDSRGKPVVLELITPTEQPVILGPGAPYTIEVSFKYDGGEGIEVGSLTSKESDYHDKFNASEPPASQKKDPKDPTLQLVTFNNNAPRTPGTYWVHVAAGNSWARGCCNEQIYASVVVELEVVVPPPAPVPKADEPAPKDLRRAIEGASAGRDAGGVFVPPAAPAGDPVPKVVAPRAQPREPRRDSPRREEPGNPCGAAPQMEKTPK